MTYTATTEQINTIRRMTGEFPAASSDYSDVEISALIEKWAGDIYAAAADVWKFKAAALASNPVKFSADGGTYDYTDAYQHCLDEAQKCTAMSPTLSASAMIIDPELKPVEAA